MFEYLAAGCFQVVYLTHDVRHLPPISSLPLGFLVHQSLIHVEDR